MFHNKGNTRPYYSEDFSGYATSLAHEGMYIPILRTVIVFLNLRI